MDRREGTRTGGRSTLGVRVATGVTVAVLLGLAATLLAGRARARQGAKPAVTVNVVGREGWWEIRYPDPQPSRTVTTANELHLPVGRPVKLVLESRDEIHCFRVPGLHGKTDLIPGRRTETTLQADHPGLYRGQCAEFYGPAHARMALVVVAEDEAAFQAWLDAQRAPAPEPASAEARRGREVFLAASCVLCHSVRGLATGATAGPDLTHFASRRTLGAGALPRTRGHVQGWVTSPQSGRPGASVPASSRSLAELQALVAWLEGLR